MKKYSKRIVAITVASLVCISSASAKPQPKPPKGKPSSFKASFTVNPAYSDLSTAKGSIDYQTKKFSSLRVDLTVPTPSTSLGITDAATAASASVHAEFARAETVFADCTLAYLASSDPASTKSKYRLSVKTNGKHDVKGTCGNGTVPALLSTDSVKLYAIVGGLRVDFLSK